MQLVAPGESSETWRPGKDDAMNKHAGNLRNDSRAWIEVPADDNGDAMIAAMAEAGVECVFFTSGSEIGFVQEAIAKANARGRKAPRLITVTHEHASLNAALGYAAVSGKPAVTVAHVDTGTLHYGGAIHTAYHSGLPVMITGGGSPTSWPGSFRGARDGGGHIWLQQSFDQNGIVRQYTKWDHRMELQDNAGLMISRALQVACTEPRGPVYLTLPREVSLAKVKGAKFPTMDQLGVAKPAAPDAEGIKEIAQRLVKAENPFVLVAKSGRNPATVPALVRLCELMALPVGQSGLRAYQCFPLNHPLYLSHASLKDADVILALDVDIPWLADSNPPPDSAWVAITDVEPSKRRVPTMEFTADLRLTADAMSVIEALETEVRKLITPDDERRFAVRAQRCAEISAKRRQDIADDAKSRAGKIPIDPKWLSYRIGKLLDDNCILFDETIAQSQVHDYLNIAQPGAYFHNPASSGGWAPGAAFGAKLAAPDKDVIAVSGDGFYMFGTPVHALWAARHYKAPFLQIVYQNRSYSTGTLRINSVYGKDDSYAAKAGYDGGYFDPPIDFAKEAEAAGAYGELVTDPGEVEHALRRGLKAIREDGKPAVISVWLARLLQKD
jgi:acetolactate synthase I/II/III large subunit